MSASDALGAQFPPSAVEHENDDEVSRFGGYRHRDWFKDEQPYEVRKMPVAPLAAQADKTEEFLRSMEGRKRATRASAANITDLAGQYRRDEKVGRMVVHEHPETGELDLLDGHHRAVAARRAKRENIEVFVNRGTRRQ